MSGLSPVTSCISFERLKWLGTTATTMFEESDRELASGVIQWAETADRGRGSDEYSLHGRIVATLEPLLVPGAIGIANALHAAVVPPVTVEQVDLLDLRIGGHVERFVASRNL